MNHPSPGFQQQGFDYAETTNVQDLHAAIRRDKPGERITIAPFSLWMLVVLGLAFFLAGFFSARPGGDFTAANLDQHDAQPAQATLQARQTSAASASKVSDANAPVVAHVTMKNMKFLPATIEISKGDTVEWRNDDITPHTATSPNFDSGSIDPDKSWRYLFSKAGNFPYACTFHPEMKAAVVVK